MVQRAAAAGWAAPSAIQRAALPAILLGRDVLGQAPTGSGKTAAFLLPLLQRLLAEPGRAGERPRRLRALILAPTRELAAQIGKVAKLLAPELKAVIAVGGLSINPQMMTLRGGADLLVATPGRLLDLVDHNALRLTDVAVCVLDEADRLLDLGFADEIGRVLALLPARRQNLFFSATFPPEVQALAQTLLREPVRLEVEATPANEPNIVQRVIAVDAIKRTELLRHLLKENEWSRVLVFVATKYAAEHVAWKLHKNGIFATPFHGDLSQGARTKVLAEFKNEQWDVVVTTDLAARGIDIAQLPVVINYDLPRSAVDYVHRIGRTGRAGEPGLAVRFVSAGTDAHFALIEKRQGLSLPREVVPGFEPTEVPLPAVPGNGGVKGKRPSKKDKLRAAAVKGG